MITQPNSNRPWLHALCTVALGLVIAVSFGSAKAQDEKPNRNREAERTRESDAPGKTGEKGDGIGKKQAAAKDGEGMKKAVVKDGESGKKPSAKDGEGGKKPGTKDGEGAKKIGARDGEGGKKPGAKDGEGAKKTGARDGEGGKKPGAKDGEGAKKIGARDGEGGKKSAEGARDGAESASGGKVVMHITAQGQTILVNGEKIRRNELRAHLSEFLPEHKGAQVSIEADDDVPFKIVSDVLDAARDNGAKKATITTGGK